MALPDVFQDNFLDWFKTIEEVKDIELKENIDNFDKLYSNLQKAHKLFAPIAEKLPIDHATWIYGNEKIIPKSSSIQLIIEFVIQSLYLQVCHLWPAANHSARCSLEHTLLTIWQISNPKESTALIGDQRQTRFSTMVDDIFNIKRFSKSNSSFEIKDDGGLEKNLKDKINEVYSHLSYYIHTSNIHIDTKGARPHITHDLKKNPKAERDTGVNIEDTYNLILILLALSCKEHLEPDTIAILKTLLNPNLFESLEKCIVQ